MSRIQATFATLKSQGKKALIPYITAGDPHPKHTVALMHALVQAGSDIIELGVPFSDPMADGPVIQRATERALAHKVGLINVLEMVREFRRVDDRTPVVLMGYANPIEAMGQAKFAERACAAGVDGVLTVDYPPEECQDFVQLLKSQQLDPIFLLSPTSDSSRVDMIVHQAAGFVYYVSLKGVTGSQNIDIAEVGTRVKAIRSRTDLPVGVGFGVRDAATAKAVAEIADAVVIGSRMIQEIENSSEDALLSNVAALAQSMRTAIDDAKT
ncbi:tryptophan synthase subunit alpha [Methylobacillus sp.]|uniref:tryptophan synthase subunit alpha n=1 Tax=Methylobacillus sp. TaxID=56818 RepID=UPI0012CD6421|nr:tryptophan synthase subunit alpha [Methylobacillus sp.]MPS48806.1 tryptophan synthase subunit alpha [Methylobacillus sp.]